MNQSNYYGGNQPHSYNWDRQSSYDHNQQYNFGYGNYQQYGPSGDTYQQHSYPREHQDYSQDFADYGRGGFHSQFQKQDRYQGWDNSPENQQYGRQNQKNNRGWQNQSFKSRGRGRKDMQSFDRQDMNRGEGRWSWAGRDENHFDGSSFSDSRGASYGFGNDVPSQQLFDVESYEEPESRSMWTSGRSMDNNDKRFNLGELGKRKDRKKFGGYGGRKGNNAPREGISQGAGSLPAVNLMGGITPALLALGSGLLQTPNQFSGLNVGNMGFGSSVSTPDQSYPRPLISDNVYDGAYREGRDRKRKRIRRRKFFDKSKEAKKRKMSVNESEAGSEAKAEEKSEEQVEGVDSKEEPKEVREPRVGQKGPNRVLCLGGWYEKDLAKEIEAAVRKAMRPFWPRVDLPFYCQYCDHIEFKTEKQLRMHEKGQDHLAMKRKAQHRFCEICQLYFAKRPLFHAHCQTEQHIKLREILREARRKLLVSKGLIPNETPSKDSDSMASSADAVGAPSAEAKGDSDVILQADETEQSGADATSVGAIASEDVNSNALEPTEKEPIVKEDDCKSTPTSESLVLESVNTDDSVVESKDSTAQAIAENQAVVSLESSNVSEKTEVTEKTEEASDGDQDVDEWIKDFVGFKCVLCKCYMATDRQVENHLKERKHKVAANRIRLVRATKAAVKADRKIQRERLERKQAMKEKDSSAADKNGIKKAADSQKMVEAKDAQNLSDNNSNSQTLMAKEEIDTDNVHSEPSGIVLAAVSSDVLPQSAENDYATDVVSLPPDSLAAPDQKPTSSSTQPVPTDQNKDNVTVKSEEGIAAVTSESSESVQTN